MSKWGQFIEWKRGNMQQGARKSELANLAHKSDRELTTHRSEMPTFDQPDRFLSLHPFFLRSGAEPSLVVGLLSTAIPNRRN
jgi:hypothetical protein